MLPFLKKRVIQCMKKSKGAFLAVVVMLQVILTGCNSENERDFPIQSESSATSSVISEVSEPSEESSEPEISEAESLVVSIAESSIPEKKESSAAPESSTVSQQESSEESSESSVQEEVSEEEPESSDPESYYEPPVQESPVEEPPSPSSVQYYEEPESIPEEKPVPVITEPSMPEGNSIVNVYQCYTSEAVERDIKKLAYKYPQIITTSLIGYSTNSKPITCVMLGNGEKSACVVAGIHAREHITISFTMRCIEEFAEAYTKGEKYGEYDICQLLNEYTLYIVPMCNPDGTDIAVTDEIPLIPYKNFNSDSYKANANGVNLNRNFPFRWEKEYGDGKIKQGEETYPGPYGGSENETIAIMNLCSENHFSWLLDMHIVGNGIYWRDTTNGPIINDSYFANSIANRCGYQVFAVSSSTFGYSGGLENWFRYTYKNPALCIEMVPYSQSNRSTTYRGFNSYFEQAVNWSQSRYTYLEAMRCML